MPIVKGEVYVPKAHKKYALIVDGFNGSTVIVRNSNSRDFNPFEYTTIDDLLKRYEKATPKQLEPLIHDLKERQSVIARKISYLEGFAQSQPMCTESRMITGIDRGPWNR